MVKIIISVCSVLVVFTSAQAQQQCRNVDKADFETVYQFKNNGKHVVDNSTGLTWYRCLVGQIFDDNKTPDDPSDDKCTGKAKPFSRVDALTYVSKQKARMPNIKELASIVNKRCRAPAIHLDTFPNTENEWVWSSTFSARQSASFAFSVNFELGNVGTNAEQGLLRLIVTP